MLIDRSLAVSTSNLKSIAEQLQKLCMEHEDAGDSLAECARQLNRSTLQCIQVEYSQENTCFSHRARRNQKHPCDRLREQRLAQYHEHYIILSLIITVMHCGDTVETACGSADCHMACDAVRS